MREGGLLAAVAMALIVLPQVALAVLGVPIGTQPSSMISAFYIAAVLLSFVCSIALNRLAIGPSVTVREAIAQGFVRLLPVFLVLFVLALLVVILTVAIATVLSLGGLMTLPRTGQAPPASLVLLMVVLFAAVFAIFQLIFPLAAAETGNPIRLITRSWRLGSPQYMRLLAFLAVVIVGLMIVGLAGQFGVGSVVTILLGRPNPGTFSALLLGLIAGTIQAAWSVTTAVMLSRIYLQLSGHEDAQPSVPRSGI